MSTILHVIPCLEGGGSERQLALLVSEQARRGWDAHVALRRGGVHEATVRASGASIHQLGDLRSIHPLLVWRLRDLSRRLLPDIVQTWLPQMDIVGGAVAATMGYRWIISERSTAPMHADTPVISGIRTRLARAATAVVANSDEGARYWHHKVAALPTITIRNAVDVEAVRRAPLVTLAAPSRRVILCVGRLHPVKAPQVLIDAAAGLPADVELLFIGDGPLRDSLAQRVSACGLTGSVRLLPYRPDWWGLLKTATALASPSLIEGAPNVVLEAMAAGCPLVVSNIPAHREILDDRSAILANPGDAGALRAAILDVLENPAAARMRAEVAQRRVGDSTIENVADAYEHVYRQSPPGGR